MDILLLKHRIVKMTIRLKKGELRDNATDGRKLRGSMIMRFHRPPYIAATAWLGCHAIVAAFLLQVPAYADFNYKVAQGDTLWDIAIKFDVSLTEILTRNGISDNQVLSIGQDLVIPSECDYDYTQVKHHKVKAGECLSVIAGKYGVSVAAICALNGISTDESIHIDQVLSIPPGCEGSTQEDPPQKVETKSYTVVAGDSAWVIARKFDVPMGALLSYNGLNEDSILTVGQKLKIPGTVTKTTDRGLSVKTYAVKAGDCLSLIAKKFDISVATICSLNGIKKDDVLHIGQELRVPSRPEPGSADRPAKKLAPIVVDEPEQYNGDPLPPLTVPAVNSAAGEAMRGDSSVFDFTSRQEEFSISGYFDGNYTYYRIEPGDCISYLADCFNLTTEEICKASNLTDVDYIIQGQIIKLPGKHDVTSLRKYKDESTSSGGKKLVQECLNHLGLDYHYGSEDLGRGVDCSGLIWAIVKRDYGISLPRSAKDLSDTDYGIPVSYDALKEGDMVFFHTTRPGISHVGVYMGNGKFVHASSARGEVAIDRLDKGYYKERFIKALRLKFL
jgi:LysM repeat protein